MILSSMFRDAAAYIDRYFTQIAGLRELVDVSLVIAEGDSTDDTAALLKERIGDTDILLTVDHGGPRYGSTDLAARWQQISVVARAITREVDTVPFVWVEADLIWEPKAIVNLARDAEQGGAVAPLVLAGNTVRLYDYWGFRKDGRRLNQYPPYYPPLAQSGHLVKLDSCGSCWATCDLQIVREWDGMWPHKASGQLWLDPTVTIRHPE